MILSALNRRQFLTNGFAVGLFAVGGFGARGAALEGTIFPRPFAGSRTVASFADGLFFCEDAMPLPLLRAIEVELARTDVAPSSLAEERRRAEFFAWLAVRNIAPRALRRAGYEALAADCEKQPDLRNGMSASGQHTIGRQYAGTLIMPQNASRAYGACAHASTTAFYTGHEDINVVIETGHYCARALLDGSFYDDDIDAADATWIWDFAAMAINAATDLT